MAKIEKQKNLLIPYLQHKEAGQNPLTISTQKVTSQKDNFLTPLFL